MIEVLEHFKHANGSYAMREMVQSIFVRPMDGWSFCRPI